MVNTAAVFLKDKDPGLLHKEVRMLAEEKVRGEHRPTEAQALLGRLEVELDCELVDKSHNGVGVLALVHDLYDVTHEPAAFRGGVGSGLLGGPLLAEEHGGRDVSQEVGALVVMV